MNDLDKKILTEIQSGLPAEERPFDALAARLGIGADEFLDRLRRLARAGVIRRIGPVFDSRRLGYASTLVAARVPPERLAEVAARVSRLPGVTHNYERRHAWNLWFTLAAPSAEEIERTLDDLRRETGLREFHSLPAEAVYKIRVQFEIGETGETFPTSKSTAGQAGRGTHIPSPLAGEGGRRPGEGLAPAEPLSEEQKELVRLIQGGLAIEREPLIAAAARLGWTPMHVAEQIRQWLASGVIRRFGAVLAHRDVGYAANGMAAFRVPAERVDAAGRLVAAHAEVSHCYRRPVLEDFPYNLYAMIHGRSEAEVLAAAARMAAETGAEAHEVLFSVREFKKIAMRYFVEGTG
jgi:DNA-binding Lrp family transcriptional regulator